MAVVTDVGRVAVDAEVLATNGAFRVRRSRVVLAPRCCVKFLKGQKLIRSDGGKKARSPGRARYKP